MNVICTDTNAMIDVWHIPVGTFELPVHGSLTVFTSNGASTNLQCGTGDTLVVWSTGAGVIEGVDVIQMFLLGVWLVVGVFGVLAGARRIAKILHRGPSAGEI